MFPRSEVESPGPAHHAQRESKDNGVSRTGLLSNGEDEGMTEQITSLADVRPGDIGIMKMGGFFPGFFPVQVGEWLLKESFRIGPYSADHVLICVEAERTLDFPEVGWISPRAVQAMPSGAEEIALTPAKHWTDGAAWFRILEDYPGQATDAAAIAREFVAEKVPYSFLSYLALAAWSRGLKAERLEKWIGRRGQPVTVERYIGQPGSGFNLPGLPAEAICSVLVDQAWSLAGKRVMEGVARQCVTPGAMAIQLYRRPGVILGGPGFLASS